MSDLEAGALVLFLLLAVSVLGVTRIGGIVLPVLLGLAIAGMGVAAIATREWTGDPETYRLEGPAAVVFGSVFVAAGIGLIIATIRDTGASRRSKSANKPERSHSDGVMGDS